MDRGRGTPLALPSGVGPRGLRCAERERRNALPAAGGIAGSKAARVGCRQPKAVLRKCEFLRSRPGCWLAYCRVDGGRILQLAGRAAVRERRTSSRSARNPVGERARSAQGSRSGALGEVDRTIVTDQKAHRHPHRRIKHLSRDNTAGCPGTCAAQMGGFLGRIQRFKSWRSRCTDSSTSFSN